MKKLLAMLALDAVLIGCGSNSTGTHTSMESLSGSWHALLTSTSGGSSFTVDIFVVQSGTSLTSTNVALGGGTCSYTGTTTGSISGSNINLVITGNEGDLINITGSVSSNNAFSGSYTTKTSGCGIGNDSGTLSATLIPPIAGSSWTGVTQSTRYPPGQTTFTANLSEDASGNVTGIMSFTGSTCSFLANESMNGTQTGDIIFLNDNAADGINLGGAIDSVAKNTSGSYSISICNGDEGTFAMIRP